MGMHGRQLLMMVELPLALPVVMAGIRTTAVMNIGIAAIAAYIGAGGLGTLIFQGISRADSVLILAGALPVSALALATDGMLAAVERALSPRAARAFESRPEAFGRRRAMSVPGS
jgi:osmoprotectant transport system permease protein